MFLSGNSDRRGNSFAPLKRVTLQCTQNRIPGCKCGKTRKQPQGNRDWQWGRCSDNIKFGERGTRRFIDKLEKGNDARTAFNLHNNAVGRKVSWGILKWTLVLFCLTNLLNVSKFL